MAGDRGAFYRTEEREKLKKITEDPKLIHFVGMIMPARPGIQLCLTELEYKYYVPGTKRNDDFQLRIMEWSEIVWAIATIPIDDRHLMERVAGKCGLRIADGVPTMMTGNGIEQFPLNGDRVFSLENKSGHPIYHNSQEISDVVKKAEEDNVDKILEGHELKDEK